MLKAVLEKPSLASFVALRDPDVKEEDEESDQEEDTGMREAAEVPVPSSPGGASPKRKPKGGKVSFSPGSGTGSSTSPPAKARGGGMSTLCLLYTSDAADE